MARPPIQSMPPSQPSSYRYLGRGGGEGPARIQMMIALVAGLVLVAIPLYLWRKPRPETANTQDASTVTDGGVDAGSVLVPTLSADASALLVDAGPTSVTLTPFTTLKCENPGPGKTPPERCDHVSYFEDALARAIRENALCAPPSSEPLQVSFVFEMDFRRKKTNLYTGKSSTLKKERAKNLVKCIHRAMPTPDWAKITHQYSKYKINVTATFPPNTTF